ncbi:membrane protein [Viridibacterium curvum]|uniref:Membrane protein n=1 Tax=Viridibacterium curvum TaxID=1101404 RepID=A0ABP9QYZ5_9RHOO
MLLLLAVSAAPVVAALVMFYFVRSDKVAVSGELINPPQALALDTVKLPGSGVLADKLRGKWVMALRAEARCAEPCRQMLYYMRQVRTLQAKEMDRVQRLWVAEGDATPEAALLADHPDLLVVRDATLAAALGPADRIVLVDPRGFLMMRYAAAPEAKGIVKDLQKLLKYTR